MDAHRDLAGHPTDNGRMMHLRQFLAIVAIATSLPALAAQADVGAGVGAITLQPIKASVLGKNVSLTPLYVANTGTVETTYLISVEAAPPTKGVKPLPAKWVVLSKTTVTLAAAKAMYVPTSVKVPKGTRDGSYRTFVTVRSVPGVSDSAANAGAAAATDIVLKIRNGRLGGNK